MLIERTEKYQAESEEEASKLIEKYKNEQISGGFDLAKAGYTRKPIKVKGEVIGEIFTVTITQKFN